MIDRKQIRTVIIISGIFFLTGLLFFLWQSNLFVYKNEIDASKFGQFGDYIGGILGTIFAGLSFILLIYTYHIQRDANETNHQNQDLSYINNLYDNIVNDINNLTFTEHSLAVGDDIQHKGIDAFYNFRIDNYQTPNSVMNHLNTILFLFKNLISIAKNAQYRNEKIKNITLTRIYFLYYSKVLWPVHEHMWKADFLQELIRVHDDSKYIFPRYKKLAKETVDHLVVEKVIAPDKEHIQDIMREN